MAAAKYALKGRVVTMDAARTVMPSGVVWIDGTSIAAVTKTEQQLPEGFAGVSVTDTKGTIYPGLIELHNHLAYNAMKLWFVPKLFGNRDQWQDNPSYKQLVTRPLGVLASSPEHVAAIARYTEAKCLFGGVTTSQGITLAKAPTIKRYYRGVIRNVEQPMDNNLPAAATKIADTTKKEEIAKLAQRLTKLKCYLGHLSEGVDAKARKFFLNLEFEPDRWALGPAYCGIHANGLHDADLVVLRDKGAGIIWSPLSNLLLYGKTTLIKKALQLKIRIALGSDWSPSGSRNLLGEMKIVRMQTKIDGLALKSDDIVAMATSTPAQMLGWDKLLGSVEKGKYADLVVIKGKAGNAYDHLIDADETAIRAVIIGGRVRLADPALALIPAADAEPVPVDGTEKYIDLQDPDADPLVAGMTLHAATKKLTDGLARIPELHADLLARARTRSFTVSTSPERTWFLVLDDHEHEGEAEIPASPAPSGFGRLARTFGRGSHDLYPPIMRELKPVRTSGLARGFVLKAATQLPLVPLELDPLTIAGDKNYGPALRKQMNLSNTLKTAIKKVFG